MVLLGPRGADVDQVAEVIQEDRTDILQDRAALPQDKAAFLQFASECFRHKRKTLRNNLAPRYGRERMDALKEGRLRAEQLSVEQLAALYRQLAAA